MEEKTGGAASRAYSFIQLQSESRVSAKAEEVKDRAVALIQQLADKDGSKMLSLLAQRIQSAALMGADPFAKVSLAGRPSCAVQSSRRAFVVPVAKTFAGEGHDPGDD